MRNEAPDPMQMTTIHAVTTSSDPGAPVERLPHDAAGEDGDEDREARRQVAAHERPGSRGGDDEAVAGIFHPGDHEPQQAERRRDAEGVAVEAATEHDPGDDETDHATKRPIAEPK